MTLKERVQKLKKAIAPAVNAVQPVVKVAERVMRVAVHLQKPTPLSVFGLVSTGLAALSEQLRESSGPGWTLNFYTVRGQVLKAITEAGVELEAYRPGEDDNNEYAMGKLGSFKFCVQPSGDVMTYAPVTDEFIEWLRQALDRVLPAAVEVRAQQDNVRDSTRYEARAIALSSHENEQADAILAATRPLLEGGRCILLDGKPGVGKTTMAQIIARKADLGRTVMLTADALGASSGCSFPAVSMGSSSIKERLTFLSPGVVIVDDIDKLDLSLSKIEAMRAVSKLVILTANNGSYDEVLDGALMRAGRVDEVFSIAPVEFPRVAPFDKLADDEWTEVKEWPVAYINEVRKRLQSRPDELRLEDLRARLTRRTRSAGGVLQ